MYLVGRARRRAHPHTLRQASRGEVPRAGMEPRPANMSSSFLGFGNGSLARDSEELVKLMEYLCCHHNAKRFALIGHSTGCQNSVHLLKFGKKEMVDRLKVVALQAPVSDRESLYMNPGDHSSNISHARALASAGKGEEMMPRSAFWAPITASRYLSLFDVRSATGLPGGEDDFFSSDLTDEELQGRLGHVGKIGTETGLHLLAAFSKKDEYVPDSVDTDLLLKRMVDAMNGESSGRAVAEGLILENANHNLSQGRGDKEEFVDAVGRLMEQVVSED
ncbi:hypothetical protein ACHAXT_005505 [Thalassiosira profunda]